MAGNEACNGYEEGSSVEVPCALCGAAITGTVYVALVLQTKWDDWPAEWEWEDLWWPEELCAACFGDRPTRYHVNCARCGRAVEGSAHVGGAPRTYCSERCRWAGVVARREEEHREARTKVCGRCGQLFVATRTDAVFCSGRCRVASHRAERELTAWENAPDSRYSMSEEP